MRIKDRVQKFFTNAWRSNLPVTKHVWLFDLDVELTCVMVEGFEAVSVITSESEGVTVLFCEFLSEKNKYLNKISRYHGWQIVRYKKEEGSVLLHERTWKLSSMKHILRILKFADFGTYYACILWQMLSY